MPQYISIILSIIVALIALGGLAFLYFYWWLVQRPAPKIDGKLTLPILDAPVEVLRDKHGVPHIYAQSQADLFRAQGFTHAQDRMWQMEQNRRLAHGTMAELFGEAALQIDRYSRIVGFGRAAQAELETLDPESLQLLTWYADGVNAYLTLRKGRVAAEFNLLRRQPDPWTPLDTLAYSKMMAWSLSVNWEGELTRLQMLQEMDPTLAADLEPDYPADNPIILEAGSGDAMRLQSTAGLLLVQYEELKQWIGPQGAGLGSNSWAVAPARSLNGRPLLNNDPHLPVTMPSIWYENHLSCSNYEVSGVSFLGAPGVVIGHNQEVAWGLTNGFPDVQDLYIERAHPNDSTRFEFRGEWEQAQVIPEEIRIKGRSQPFIEEVIVTRHGPLINRLAETSDPPVAPQTLPLALRWTGHDPGHSIRAIFKINQAQNGTELDAALADWSAPPQNFVWADSGGNIGYVMAGAVPIRAKGLGLVPAPGWSGDHEWIGMIPHAELPRLVNPASGVIVTANNKMVGDDYPHWLGAEFFPGWRARRIEELLAEKEKHTIRDMERIQFDNTSAFARALTPWITMLYSDDPWERSALAALRHWTHDMDKAGEAGLVFHYTLLHLLDLVYGDKLGAAHQGFMGGSISPLFIINGFMHRAETRLLELLQSQEQSRWYADAKTGRDRSRDELLQEAFTRAVKAIRKDVADTSLKWHWGRMHQIRYAHPLGSVKLFSGIFDRGPFPVHGDGTTPNQTSYAPSLPPGLVQIVASYRQLYEVGAWDRAMTVTTSGQSGHPLSPNYDDQMAMWREGVYHNMPWSREAVEKGTASRLRLTP